jgi:DNA-binding NtrC family response regulator
MTNDCSNKKYVLIADDDAGMIRFVTAVVESEGLEALPAQDGKQAYKLLKSDKTIVAAIVDIRMPYIEGTEIVKFMRSDAKYASVPVIMTTGQQQTTVAAGSRSSGAVAFLPKPFTNHQLRLMLRTFLGNTEDK